MKGLQYLVGTAIFLALVVLAVMSTGGVAILAIIPMVRIAAIFIGCTAVVLIVLRLRANIGVAIIYCIPGAITAYGLLASYFGLPRITRMTSGFWLVEPFLALLAALSLLYLAGHVKRLVASSALSAERQP